MRLFFPLLVSLCSLSGCKSRDFGDSQSLETTPVAERASCEALTKRDAFMPRERIPAGPYRGLCYDTDAARPVFLLNEPQARGFGFAWNMTDYYVANISHLGSFYAAHIPMSGDPIEKILFQVEWFPAPVPAAHGQMRVDFREPITLVPQIPGEGQPFQTRHLVLSMEALGQRGWKYDLVQGLQDHFGGVWRVKTFDDFLVKLGARKPEMDKVEQFKLDLDPFPPERTEIVRVFLTRSAKYGLSKMYNTVSQSCAMQAMDVLETARVNVRERGERSGLGCQLDASEKDWTYGLMSFASEVLISIDRNVASPLEIYPPFALQALQNRHFIVMPPLPPVHLDPVALEIWTKRGIRPSPVMR